MSEITGIINNSLQRGWPLQEIYQSLLNSGYNPQEIQIEISKFAPQNVPVIPQPGSGQKLSNYQVAPVPEKKSKTKWIILSVIFVLAVILSVIVSFII